MKTLAVLFGSALVAAAQIGSPYPYPRGGSPVPGIPRPRRGKSTTTKEKDQPKVLPNFPGVLKRMDAKAIVLELDDFRVLEFRRNDKTKFFKNGDEIKPAEFKVGDRISIEGSEDPDATLTAVNVHWEKAGNGQTAQSSDNLTEEQVRAAEKEQERMAAQEQQKERATEVKPPPAPRDPEDPGPPKLQRGKPAATRKVSPAQRDESEPATPQKEAAPPQQTAAVTAPRDPDASGPPKLQRGKPAATRKVSPAQRDESEPAAPQTEAAPQQTAAVIAPPVTPPAAVVAPSATTVERIDEALPARHEDPLIRKAQEKALEFTETLPSYVCQEVIARFYSQTSPASWNPIDVVSTDLVYENGKEDYRNIKINGKAVNKKMEELSGSWSTGEFGTMLIDLFSPATSADFRFRRASRTAGIDARMYDFQVERENSHWLVRSGSQSYQPAYRGSVWIDPKTDRVLRIEMQARNMPSEFPLDKVESATDYEYVRLGTTQQYLLPVHAETLSCQHGTSRCSRNTIDFRNYHKYAGESTIQFEQQKK